MSKVKKKEELKERDEIDTYFSDAKKKGFPISIVFIILLLLCLVGIACYYFIIDNPKNILLTVIKDNFSGIKLETNIEYEQIGADYKVDINMATNNKKYINIVDILNDISLSGTTWVDYNQNKIYSMINTFYQEKDLLGFGYLYEKGTAYVKLNEIYNKVLEIKIPEEDQKEITASFEAYTKENYNKIFNSMINNLKELFLNAEYTKEYTKLDDTVVKKVTIKISKSLMEEFYDNFLNDKEFIKSYALLTDITEEEVEKEYQKLKEELDEEFEIISLYVSILENEFIMLENIYGKDRLTITKEDNKYIYKMYANSIIEYQGYISIEKNNDEYQISFSVEDIEEKLNIELNINLSLKYDETVEKFDISNSINYENLTRTDINKIITNIQNNETLVSLFDDIYTSYIDQIKDAIYPQTT